MDALLKKYAEKIVECMGLGEPLTDKEQLETERLLLEFLLEYVESKESKKDGEK